jgi:putative oxidoreductase
LAIGTANRQVDESISAPTERRRAVGEPRGLPTTHRRCFKFEITLSAYCPVYWGWQMFVSGRAHLSDVPAMVERFQEWGVPFPTFNVYVSGLTECACGLLLLVGFASRLTTIPLIVNFCVAYLTASREVLVNVFSDPDAFVSDAAFLFLLASVIVFIFGPGAFSVDAILKKLFVARRKKEAESTTAASPLLEDHHGKLRSVQ